MDRLGKWNTASLRYFWYTVWPEALREFGRGGVRIEPTFVQGEVQRWPGAQPYLVGLEPGVLNVILTPRIPLKWDQGLGLNGVTARYKGCHFCMIAVNRAHGHQIPFLSTNTLVHELLHALLQDIFEDRPEGIRGDYREFRVDCYATRMWLLPGAPSIREAARLYLNRLEKTR
jgi:hypothetical protein